MTTRSYCLALNLSINDRTFELPRQQDLFRVTQCDKKLQGPVIDRAEVQASSSQQDGQHDQLLNRLVIAGITNTNV